MTIWLLFVVFMENSSALVSRSLSPSALLTIQATIVIVAAAYLLGLAAQGVRWLFKRAR
ncbi:hypothetical protein G3A43_07370 [Paraburkholderia aspalathi]|nr:hypothetical protein [Paraburkholderia aspalathi]MBK3780073.1 hypothetical protein [Paraburkholderia aspalathi]